MRTPCLLVIFSLLVGCATADYTKRSDFELGDKAEIFSKITVTTDEFRKEVEFEGPHYKAGDNSFSKEWFITATRSENGSINTQIYLSVIYSGAQWRNLGDAAAYGEIYKTANVTKDVIRCASGGACRFREDVVFDIDFDKLDTLIGSNQNVKFGVKDGQGLNWAITISREYLEAIQNKISEA